MPNTTSPTIGATPSESSSVPPQTFRLPTTGYDPHFGITRTGYYELEKDGHVQLVRLRKRGKQRGSVFVPYDAVAAYIRKQREEQAKEKAEAEAAHQGGADRK